MKQLSLLAEDNRLARLSDLGDPLEKVKGIIDWEIFRPLLEQCFALTPKGPGGRPPLDRVMMFKIVMLQQWYNIADFQTEYQINDRLSFQRFLGLTLNDRVPDEKTIWAFKEQLKQNDTDKALFAMLTKKLEDEAIITREGSLIDASFVEVPKQRNTRDENKTIKEGEIPEEWKGKDKAAVNKRRQKDTDARWTKKNGENIYGYKNHAKVDKDTKLIVEAVITPANVHDSQPFVELVDSADNEIWADSAYAGAGFEEEIKQKNPDIILHICEKGYRNTPLTDEQKAGNNEKSKIRCRVEHVFGYQTMSMNGMKMRCIGLRRAVREITFKNMAYNLKRCSYLNMPIFMR